MAEDDPTQPGTQPDPVNENDVQGEQQEIKAGPADNPQTRPMDTPAKQHMDKQAQTERANAFKGSESES